MADWGRIMISTRLAKQVSSSFFNVWMELVTKGLRPGDSATTVKQMLAHHAQNALVRRFLASDCDTLLTLDSDADVAPAFLETFRAFEAGWEYDLLQAFYTRRGWPPEALWLKRDVLGKLSKCHVFEGKDGDPVTGDVDVAGTHACLIRRGVFETLLGDGDPDTFEWFYYERGDPASEDAIFSRDALAAGFRIGATTAVKAGHLHEVSAGWEIYQQYIAANGIPQMLERRTELAERIAAFTGVPAGEVIARAKNGTAMTRDAWERAQPQTAGETRAFYGASDNGYLYDLLAWNCSPLYERIIAPLRQMQEQHVLVVGAGLGSEIEALLPDNAVDAFELPGVLCDYLVWCLPANASVVNLLAGDTLDEAISHKHDGAYDVAVLIDVIEHIHPDEFDATMDVLARTCRAFHIHNNFGQQDSMPMHFDHSERFAVWLERHGIMQTGPFTYEVRDET